MRNENAVIPLQIKLAAVFSPASKKNTMNYFPRLSFFPRCTATDKNLCTSQQVCLN